MLIVAICTLKTSHAEEPGALVRLLGSDKFSTREGATAELARSDGESLIALSAAAESPDPEIRLRAKHLLRMHKERMLWASSPVALQADSEQASSLFTQLAETSGNPITLGDDLADFRDDQLSIHGEYATYSPWIES